MQYTKIMSKHTIVALFINLQSSSSKNRASYPVHRLHSNTATSAYIHTAFSDNLSYIMNSTEQSPWESNNRSAGQQIPGLVRKVKFHYRVHSDNTLRQMNPLHNLTLDLSTSLLSTRHGPVESTHTSYTRAPGITARPKARIS